MNDTIRFILSLSIAIASIIGMVRYRKMDSSYHPFVYYSWYVLVFEIIVYLLSLQKAFDTLAVLFNVYAIIEFYFLVWVFHKWGLFSKNIKILGSIIVVFFLAWLFSTILGRGFYKRNHYFAILYSFVLVFFSISAFNKLVFQERKDLYKNAKFWICIGVIIFFTYFIVGSSVKLLLSRAENEELYDRIQYIDMYSNLFVNILYALGLLWVPNKKNFITI
jgi:hypothetical protein